MRRGTWWTAGLALTLMALMAGSAAYAAETCEELRNRCAKMSDEQIDDASYVGPGGGPPTNLGTCYFHDRLTCPDCACHIYVKDRSFPDPSGYDGGTGCINNSAGYHASFLEAIALLRELCTSGACCCPIVPMAACPIGGPAYAKDNMTGTCCAFPNVCSIPAGWTAQSSSC